MQDENLSSVTFELDSASNSVVDSIVEHVDDEISSNDAGESQSERETAIHEIAGLESQLVVALEALKALKDKPRFTFRSALATTRKELVGDREAELLIDEVSTLRSLTTDLTAKATLFLMGSSFTPDSKDDVMRLYHGTNHKVTDEEGEDINFNEIEDETKLLLQVSRDLKVRLLELRKEHKDNLELKDAIETLIVNLLNDDKGLLEHIEQKHYFLSIHNTLKKLKEEEASTV